MINRLSRIPYRAGAIVRQLFGIAPTVGSAVAPAPEPTIAPPQPNVVRFSDLLTSAGSKYVVFFAPDAGVVAHYIAHCVVAKTLEDCGHRTLIVRCFDIFPRCVVMDSETMPMDLTAEQRRKVCDACRDYSARMTGTYGLNVIDLRDLIDAAMRRKVDTLLADLPEDVSTFEFEGVRFGRFCGAEAAVTFKTTDFAGTTPQVRRLLVWYLKGSLLSYFAMQRLLESGRIARVVHFNEYAILLAAAQAARRVGTPTTYMTMASIRGVDRRRLVFIAEPLAIISYRNRLKSWNDWRALSLPPATVQDLADDALFRISGNSVMVYSPTRTGSTDTLYERLKLEPSRKVLVAFTSSIDEVSANNQYLAAMDAEPFSDRQPFKDQIEWLEALISRVEASTDLQLVIRVHPREGANRRDNVVSTHLSILRSHFDRPYRHVRVVWPGDDVSSYDLMELADAGLSAWSSTALEMARFGIPAIIAFDRHTPLPVGDVVAWEETPEKYFALIDRMLSAPPTLDRIRYAYRWTHLHILGCSVNMDDVIPDPNCAVLPPFARSARAPAIEQILINGTASLDINRKALLDAQSEGADQAEQEMLLRQLRRLIWLTCMGTDRRDDYRLCFRERPGLDVPSGYDATLDRDGDFVAFRTLERVVRRRSRMASRLGALAGTSA